MKWAEALHEITSNAAATEALGDAWYGGDTE